MSDLKIKMYSFTMDCLYPGDLAKFYAKLLDWEAMDMGDEWSCAYVKGTAQGAYPGLLFQKNPNYIPPVWPEQKEKQQQMAHLDFAVNDLEKSVTFAISCGAKVAPEQFSKDWTVMFDLEGHPFCLCMMKSVMESPSFGLL